MRLCLALAGVACATVCGNASAPVRTPLPKPLPKPARGVWDDGLRAGGSKYFDVLRRSAGCPMSPSVEVVASADDMGIPATVCAGTVIGGDALHVLTAAACVPAGGGLVRVVRANSATAGEPALA